ncbi:MAG: hypothetical protein KDJ63_12900, partial [Nitratireductor sp.]|nr:hypothetical protein [Nitratireductor sp.]
CCYTASMQKLLALIDRLPWSVVLIACATLGLAPFTPEPHVWEKLKMLGSGTLTRPIDIFDLLLHGAPFIVAGLKVAAGRRLAA